MAEPASGKVLSIQAKIDASKRASALERAWKVAKALEEGRHQIAGLRWVEPQQGEIRISRRIDFESEFPSDVAVLKPTPVDISVLAPAKLLVPGEDVPPIAWTMPMLTRVVPARELPSQIKHGFGLFASPKPRPTIEIVSFLPFPRADALPEEHFKTEFFVELAVLAALGDPGNYFNCVTCYGGKITRQLTNDTRTNLDIYADPHNHTMFSADMLVSMTTKQLASTPANAGILDIFLYRLARGASIKIMAPAIAASIHDFDGRQEPTRSLSMELTRSPALSALPGGGQAPSLPSPSTAPKEVGEVALGEGTRGEEARVTSLDDYGFDNTFGVQQISIRFLGVREAAREATIRALEQLAAG